MIPKINSAHGSDTRNILNRAIELINTQGKSIQDLVAEGQLTPTQYAQLISIVNGNVSKGSITAADIDKNNFKLDQTYMSDSLLQMMAGNTPVNAIPADGGITTKKLANESVTPTKTTKNVSSGKLMYSVNDVPIIDFDFVNKKIKIISNARIYHQGTTYSLTPNLPELDFTVMTTNNQYVIFYNTATSLLDAKPLNATNIPPTGIVIGSFNPTIETVSGIENYTINGIVPFKYNQGFLVGEPLSVAFNSATKTLKLGTVYLIHNGTNSILTGKSFDFSGLGNYIYILYYDLETLSIGVERHNLSQNIPKTSIIFGYFKPDLSLIGGIDNYSVDGTVYSVNPEASDTGNDGIAFYSGNPEFLNFDFRNKKIEIGYSVNSRIATNSQSYRLSEQTLDISSLYIASGRATDITYLLYYDTESGIVDFTTQGVVRPENAIVFASFNPDTEIVNNVESCYINGKLNDTNRLKVSESDYYVQPLHKQEGFTSPILPSADIDSGNYIRDYLHTDFYKVYDDLIALYPEYITKTLLGYDTLDLPIYRYDFKPEEVRQIGGNATELPKVFITSGLHGYEKAGIWCLYHSLKQICENWKSDSALDNLRWNVHFVIIPVVNPSGVDADTRENSNGVDLNRNFPGGWNLGTLGEPGYGGEYPLSEPEAQYIDDVLRNEENLIYYIDFHNFFSKADPNDFIWMLGTSPFDINLSKSLISKISRKWKMEHSFLPQDDDTMFGYVEARKGATASSYAGYVGIHSSLFEICEHLPLEDNPEAFSSMTITLGVDGFINLLSVTFKNMVMISSAQ